MKEKHVFSDGYNKKKGALLAALEDENVNAGKRTMVSCVLGKAICIAAAAVLLTVSVFAAAKYIDFSLVSGKGGDTLHAGLSYPADTDEPKRAWAAGDGEVRVRLVFESMAEDLKENPTANGKWDGANEDRKITFSGYDLRRCDFDKIIKSSESPEEFYAGENRAYMIKDNSGAALYDKTFFILFEEEEMLIGARATFGISVDEMKEILSGMKIEQTDDVSLALPILNESGSDALTPIAYEIDNKAIYYPELKKTGERAEFSFGPENEEPWIKYTISTEGFEVRESFEGLPLSSILQKDFVSKFTDESGKLITYDRTEVVLGEDGLPSGFGETTEASKRLVLVTVRVDDFRDIGENPPELYLCGYHLFDFETSGDGSIKFKTEKIYVANDTPQNWCRMSEPCYCEELGGGLYRLGYILDDDQLCGELVMFGKTCGIGLLLG